MVKRILVCFLYIVCNQNNFLVYVMSSRCHLCKLEIIKGQVLTLEAHHML